jgi:hypothetical protein
MLPALGSSRPMVDYTLGVAGQGQVVPNLPDRPSHVGGQQTWRPGPEASDGRVAPDRHDRELG